MKPKPDRARESRNTTGLNIRTQGELDFLSLGALVHRLDPGTTPFRKATRCHLHVSGGEYNVAANLSDCFRLRTGIVTAMVNYPIGDLIDERVRAMGVKPFYKRFQHDGVLGPNMATVYSDRGHGARAPVVFYNRSNEAAARLGPGDVDWKKIFGAGVRWFHSGGIFAALSATTAELILEGLQAAKQAGAVTSFDLNYRANLWNAAGGSDRAMEALTRIIKHVDVLVADQEALQSGLGIAMPKAKPGSKLDPEPFFEMATRARKKHPNLKVVASTLREVLSANRHSWSAAALINGNRFVSRTRELDVLDRVGSGDGFAAGLFYGLLNGESPQDSLDLGWAHGALVTTFPGDTTMATLEQVRALARGASARIQR